MKQSKEEITSRIEELKDFLLERPKNAKVTSQLAILLAEQAKLLGVENNDHSSSISVSVVLRAEALSLAQKATHLAPAKPFGYAALSVVHPDFDQRMKYLQQAIDRCQQQQICEVNPVRTHQEVLGMWWNDGLKSFIYYFHTSTTWYIYKW